MKILQCLILEDEPIAAEILEDYIAQVPFLAFAGHCTSAATAAARLRAQAVDVLFLDLHLPGLKGFDFLATLPRPLQVIVTTAYRDYALESYEHGVVDYLMKPIEFSRFLKAVNKLQPDTGAEPAAEEQVLVVQGRQRQVRVRLDEVCYLESQRDYVLFHLEDRSIRVKATLTAMEQKLQKPNFIRIHRSFIVSKRKITAYSNRQLEIGGQTLPIGRHYRQQTAEMLGMTEK